MKSSLVHKVARIIVHAADEMYQGRMSRVHLRTMVKSDQSLATSWDVKLEKQLKKKLKECFAQAFFIGEEGTEGQVDWMKTAARQEWFWLVDPIDGTNNFINGIDYFATSVALVHEGVVVAAWVYRPAQKELFWGYQHGKKMQTWYRQGKQKAALIPAEGLKRKRSILFEDALLATTHFKSCSQQHREQKEAAWLRLSQMTRSTRKMGSAALDLSYCALGVMDGFWQVGLRPWDIAAAAFLCQASSELIVRNAAGDSWQVFDQSIIVGDRRWFDQFFHSIFC